MKNKFALITGASQGLGFSYAKELAHLGYNLLLVALPDENLSTVSKNLENEFSIVCKFYETDLTATSNIIDMCNWANTFPVSVLINNAGCGGSKKMAEASVSHIDTVIQLNITATSLITRLLLPKLAQQPKSYIMNISSMAAFSPIAYKTVYPASKKFVDYFSLGLQEELKDTNISVTVVYPGPMETNAEVSSRIKKQSYFVKSGVLTAEKTAQLSIKKMFQHKKRVVPGKLNKLSRIILKLLPTKTKITLLSNSIKKEI